MKPIDYRSIYEKLFSRCPSYNCHFETEPRYKACYDFIEEHKIDSLIDIGSGSGCFIKGLLRRFSSLDITTTDLMKFHDSDVKFIPLDLTKNRSLKQLTGKYNLLTCLDVLEHVEQKHIDKILLKLSTLSKRAIFSIANHSDFIKGRELHLIQKGAAWWRAKIAKYYRITKSDSFHEERVYLFICKRA